VVVVLFESVVVSLFEESVVVVSLFESIKLILYYII
jgi:hypothetical protein